MNEEIYEAVVDAQRNLCEKYSSEYVCAALSLKLGISKEALEGRLPIHGLRHPPDADVSGWYIWSGDYSEDPEFFEPLHAEHAMADAAVYLVYLGLAPGWRFLIGADGYEDVWFDPRLLDAGN